MDERLYQIQERINELEAEKRNASSKLKDDITDIRGTHAKEVTALVDQRRELFTEVVDLKAAVKRLERANHHQQENLDKLEKERDGLKRGIDGLNNHIDQLAPRLKLASDLRKATKGHTLENVTTIMEFMFTPADIVGYNVTFRELKIDDEHWNELDKRWDIQHTEPESNVVLMAFVRTPIIEYIPTEEITDALVVKHGRIPCEVRDTSKEQWQQGLLMEVILREEGLIYAVRTTGETMPFEYCRIKKIRSNKRREAHEPEPQNRRELR